MSASRPTAPSRRLLAPLLLFAFLPAGLEAQAGDRAYGSDGAASSLRLTGEVVQGGVTQRSGPGTSLAGTSTTVGGALGVQLHKHITVRGSILFSETDLNGGPGSPFRGRTGDLWYYDAEVLVSLPVTLLRDRITPYVIGGIGGRTFDVSGLGAETNVAGAFGGGLEVKMDDEDPWAISVEVRDFVSPFDRQGVSTTQHDLLWTIGLRYVL